MRGHRRSAPAYSAAWLAGCAIAHGWRRGDRLLLAVAYVGVLTTLLGAVTHVQVAPFLLGGLLLTAYERSSKPGA